MDIWGEPSENCVEAKEAGVRMASKNDAERKDPGVGVSHPPSTTGNPPIGFFFTRFAFFYSFFKKRVTLPITR